MDTNSFAGLYRYDTWKFAYLGCHVLLSFICPVLLCSIVWYEKYSADSRSRTLMNQLLSHLCIIVLLSCLIARPLSILVLLIGPFSSQSCDGVLLVARYLFVCSLFELVLKQIIRYFYIFQWKHLVHIDDDFGSTYITLCNCFLSAVYAFAAYFLGYHYSEMDFHICR